MEFLIAIAALALIIIPMWKLSAHAGLSPYWSLACVIPFGIIILLWIIAGRLTGGKGV